MAANSEEGDEDYMDDPISLMAIDIKQECDEDIIDIGSSSSDEEESITSSYGKKNFVLPITFFDSARNLRLLSKCKPMTVQIVDCKDYPTYYSDCTGKSKIKSEIIDQEELKCENINEDEIKTDNEPLVINDSIIHKEDKDNRGDELNTEITVQNDSIIVSNKVQESDKPNTQLQNNLTNDSIIENKGDEIQDGLMPTQSLKSLVINNSITVHKVAIKQQENKVVNEVQSMITNSHERDKTKIDLSCVVINESITLHKLENNQNENKQNTDVQNIVTNNCVTIQRIEKKQEEEKKRRASRGHSYYENLKKRKENRKEKALSCKDLSQVDFKRNTGLVGLKITDTIFKQIVNSEKVLTDSKKMLAEYTSKEHDLKEMGKNEKVVEIKTYGKSNNVSNKSEIQRRLSVTTSADNAETIYKEKCKYLIDKKCNKDNVRCADNQHEKTEGERTSTSNSSRKSNEKRESNINMKTVAVEKQAETTFVKSNISSGIDKPYEKSTSHMNEVKEEKEAEKRLTMTVVTPVTEKPNENTKSNIYMKEVGVTLDNLGTTIIPVADTGTNNHVSKNVNEYSDKIIKTNTNSATIVDKPRTNNDIGIRCSIKIPSKKIVEKVLKLKQITHYSKQTTDELQKVPDQRSPKENMAKAVPNSQPSYNTSYVGSDKKKLKGKREKKQVLKSVDASKKNQAGPNSPVLPCTTITPRPASKPAHKIWPFINTTPSKKPDDRTGQTNVQTNVPPVLQTVKPSNTSSVQKISALPKVATSNQMDSINISKKVDPPRNNPTISYPNITVVNKPKSTTITNQDSPAHTKAMKAVEDKYPQMYPLMKHLFDIKSQGAPMTEHRPDHTPKTNQTNRPNQNTPIQSKSATGNINNQSTNGLAQNQTQAKTNPQTIPTNTSKFSGMNAIIFRRPPPPLPRDILSSELQSQGHPIQTLVSQRPQYPGFGSPMRFTLPPPPPPPPRNCPPNMSYIRPDQRFIPPGRMNPVCWRGPGMALHRLRFPGPCLPSQRPPMPTHQITNIMRPLPPPTLPPTPENLRTNPEPLNPQVNNSFIGITSDGDPIKRINILPQTNTVNDKQMMLAELNNAMMSPELISNTPEQLSNDLKRKADTKPEEPVKPKFSKPCPLSKKLNVTPDTNKAKIPEQAPPNIGYSPPILPIWTYEESFQKFSHNDPNMKRLPTDDTQNHTPSRVNYIPRIMKQKTTNSESGKQDLAKKITFEDYRKRVGGGERIDAAKIRKFNEVKNMADDCNQDLGYDSDTTVKL